MTPCCDLNKRLAGPASPSPAQARPGLPDFGIQQMQKVKILKIKIRSAQNVGKVWISRKNTFPAPFGAFQGHFFAWAGKNKKKIKKMCIFLGGQWALFTRSGPCHLPAAMHHEASCLRRISRLFEKERGVITRVILHASCWLAVRLQGQILGQL